MREGSTPNCGKNEYCSKKEAKIEARKLNQTAYHCKHCGLWHLATNIGKKKLRRHQSTHARGGRTRTSKRNRTVRRRKTYRRRR